MKLRSRLALFIAKLSIPLLKLTRHTGTNFPGEIALRICPDFLAQIDKPKKIYMVTGTVGKTTVSNMLSDLLKELGSRVLNNSEGSNINSGIATTLIKGVTFFGRSRYDIAVLELDERHSRTVGRYISPDCLLITNITQDSIMRHAHPEYIASILDAYIPKDTLLVLNADNLHSCFIAKDNKRVTFSLAPREDDVAYNTDMLSPINLCPQCASPLVYDFMRGAELGRATCPACGFSSPAPDFVAKNIDFTKASMLIATKNEHGQSREYPFPIINDSVFNIYNEVSVLALLLAEGYEATQLQQAIKKIGITKKRFAYVEINGTRIRKMSAKGRGSYGCSRLFDAILSDPSDKEIILLLNSEASMDGWAEDTCWLYDCAFEKLTDPSIKRIVIAGESAADYLLRLRLAGIDESKIVQAETALEAPDKLLYFPNDSIYSIVELDLQVLAETLFEKIINNVKSGGVR